MADLFDNLRRDGTSSSDVAHEFWNVVDRVGRAVGEQEDRGASWERVQHLEIDFVSARARRPHDSRRDAGATLLLHYIRYGFSATAASNLLFILPNTPAQICIASSRYRPAFPEGCRGPD